MKLIKSFKKFEKIWESRLNEESNISFLSGEEESKDDPRIKKLEEKLKKYKKLSTSIDVITQKYQELIDKELDKLPEELDSIKAEIEEDIKELKIQKMKTDGVVVSFRKSYTQASPKYKPAFDAALTKVNSATKKILESLIKQFTKPVEIPSKVSIKRESLSINENLLNKITTSIKNAVKRGITYLGSLVKSSMDNVMEDLPALKNSTDELENITKQISDFESKESDREIPKWQADQY